MRIINTDKAPKAIGPYSQGVISNGFIFVSGQIALDPDTNSLISGGIEEQTLRVLENIEAILEAAGSSKEKVVRCDVFLTDLKLFPSFNKAYEKFFGEHKPTRVTVEVSSLPKGALVEISAIAEI
ncbi:MAG TPA: RidA family protein [candidate division Zixibacteria bacterium]|nr:RidA family protein [candidate division Zixibacteria bacterium]